MIRFHQRAIFVTIITLIATLLLAGCGDPKKDARQELSKMNVEYTADAFNKAIESKDDTVVQLFFKAGFDLSSKDDNGKTPCMAAANSGNMDVLNKMVQSFFLWDERCVTGQWRLMSMSFKKKYSSSG